MRCFTGEQLRSYCTQVLTRAGISPTDAATVADCLSMPISRRGNPRGSRLSSTWQRLDAGVVEKENRVRVLSESPAALAVDAGNCMGRGRRDLRNEKMYRKGGAGGFLLGDGEILQPFRYGGLLHQDGRFRRDDRNCNDQCNR